MGAGVGSGQGTGHDSMAGSGVEMRVGWEVAFIGVRSKFESGETGDKVPRCHSLPTGGSPPMTTTSAFFTSRPPSPLTVRAMDALLLGDTTGRPVEMSLGASTAIVTFKTSFCVEKGGDGNMMIRTASQTSNTTASNDRVCLASTHHCDMDSPLSALHLMDVDREGGRGRHGPERVEER